MDKKNESVGGHRSVDRFYFTAALSNPYSYLCLYFETCVRNKEKVETE